MTTFFDFSLANAVLLKVALCSFSFAKSFSKLKRVFHAVLNVNSAPALGRCLAMMLQYVDDVFSLLCSLL